jgi:hypothetical protein
MRITRLGLLEWTVIAALAMAAACDNSTEITNAGGNPSNVVASACSPAIGDATLTVTGRSFVNYNDNGYDMVYIWHDSGQNPPGVQSVTVTWDTNTHVLRSVEYGWGDALMWTGFAMCGPGNQCDESRVTIDFEGHDVTFTGMVLTDPRSGGTDTARLDGTLRW